MDNAFEREKSQSNPNQTKTVDIDKQSGQKIYTEPDNPPKQWSGSESDEDMGSSKGEKQQTGGPGKPTA
jgi:hypothetical protein